MLPEIISSVIIAVFGGGALVKLVEISANRRKNRMQISADERENLRQDIILLRNEINDLRTEVDSLREELNERQQEINEWTTKFFSLKLAVEKIMIYLKSKNSTEKDAKLKALVQEASEVIEQNNTPE